jgi:ribosomal-protein-alanine N-acetyltransferase
MHYRLYQSADFPQLYAIELLCFQPPFRFSRRYMQQLIANPNSATWIAESRIAEAKPTESKTAEQEREMTAFAIVEWSTEDAETTAYIQTLEVAPAHRKRGIATQLLSRLESSATTAGASAITLHVAEPNSAAIHLYQTHGYQPRGREEDYYAQGIAALTYFKPLN